MRVLVFSIYDSKVESYGPLFTAKTEVAAVRLLSDSLRQGSLPLISAHPEDYSLVVVGDFDDETGLMSGVERRTIAGADALVRLIENGRKDPSQLSLVDDNVSESVG